MNRAQPQDTFGRRRKEVSDARRQSPLIEDVKQQRRAGRKPTSQLEQRWPVYLGVGIPALVFAGIMALLIFHGLSNSALSIRVIFIALPFLSVSFLISALVLTYILSSIRNGAETLGNMTLMSKSNTGFKIGAAIGLGLFFWFTPAVFGDPFTGNPSAPSAIVAQFMLKALSFMGLLGMVGSRLEKRVRKTV